MKKTRIIAAGVLSAGIAVSGFAVAGPAAAGTVTCYPIQRSADGHTASVKCTSGSGTKFVLRAQACNAGGCSTLTSSPTSYGGTAYLNAGSAYIDQNTFQIGTN